MQTKLIRSLAVAGGVAVVLVGCGLKEGVVVLAEQDARGGGGGGVVGDDSTDGSVDGTVDDNSGNTIDPSAGQTGAAVDPGSGGVATESPTGGTGGNGGGGGGGGNGGGGAGGGTFSISGTDRTGVSDDTIHIAVHAPVTGAAPLPARSFEEAGDTYWLWKTQKQGQTVLGRSNVVIEFADDKYDPNTARGICRDLATRNFMVVGGGGTDQIQACGSLAGVSGFPYFSFGVTQAGLETSENPWYFAGSMSYRQQGVLLASYIKARFGNALVGAIFTQTPNFDDAVAGWEEGVAQSGINLYKTVRHTKGDTSWYNVIRDDFADAGVEIVYILSSPLDYIRFAQASAPNGFTPQYVGVGVTKGLNALLPTGCPEVDGGEFFSPFPGLDVVDDLAPDFRTAAGDYGKPSDDLALALWGLAATLDKIFIAYEQAYGSTDLTREDFRALMETQTVETGIFPRISWSPGNHFGGTGVHVLKADCDAGIHTTFQSFASSFQ